MSDIKAVTAALDAAVAAIEKAEGAGAYAADGFEQSSSQLGQALYGTTDPEMAALPGMFQNQAIETTNCLTTLAGAKTKITTYLAKIGGPVPPANPEVRAPRGREDAGEAATGSSGQAPEPDQERAGRLRKELPPPIKPGEQGRKTHGRWFGGDEYATEIVSGRDEMAAEAQRQLEALGIPGVPSATADVETKLAAHMAANEITHASVVINYAPCKGVYGCENLVPALLPEGSSLTVYGVAPDGTETEQIFEGGATPWWQQ